MKYAGCLWKYVLMIDSIVWDQPVLVRVMCHTGLLERNLQDTRFTRDGQAAHTHRAGQSQVCNLTQNRSQRIAGPGHGLEKI